MQLWHHYKLIKRKMQCTTKNATKRSRNVKLENAILLESPFNKTNNSGNNLVTGWFRQYKKITRHMCVWLFLPRGISLPKQTYAHIIMWMVVFLNFLECSFFFFKQNICCWGSGEQFLTGWWCFRLFVSKSKRFLCVSLAFGVGRYFDRFTPSWFMALAGFILEHISSLI